MELKRTSNAPPNYALSEAQQAPPQKDSQKHQQQVQQQQQQQQQQVRLKQTIGLSGGVSIIIGIIIGSGIFVSPRGVLVDSGSVGVALLVWCFCGLLALLGALCFVELGTSISSSGGEYTYIRLAYGQLPSFLYLWTTLTILMPCANAITALTFANYVLQPFYLSALGASTCDIPTNALRLTALALVLAIVYLNSVSVKGSMRLQGTFALAKVLALVLIISYGLYHLISGQSAAPDSKSGLKSAEVFWFKSQTSLPHLAQAFYAGFYTYSGWNALNMVTEEMKDPVRTMPRAILLSMGAITLIYILTNLAYFALLSPDEILASDAIAVVFGERALSHLGLLGSFNWLMPISVALSTIGGLNGGIFTNSRVLFAGARQGQLFKVLNMIHLDYLTPIPAIIFLGSLTSVYLLTTDIHALMTYMVFVETLFLAVAVSTVLTIRFKRPDLHRPFMIPLFVPYFYLLMSAFLVILPIWSSPIEALVGVLILLTGVPAYYLTAHWKVKPVAYQRLVDNFNKITQALTLSVEPDAQQLPKLGNV